MYRVSLGLRLFRGVHRGWGICVVIWSKRRPMFFPHTEGRNERQRAACRYEDLLMLDELQPEKVPIKISPMDQIRTGFHLLSPSCKPKPTKLWRQPME